MRPVPRQVRTVLWLGCLASAFVATHVPPGHLHTEHWPNDLVLHGLGFFALGLVTVWRLTGDRHGVGRTVGRWLLLLGGYAAMDEWTQPLVGRSCELADWLADVSGAALGLAAASLWFAAFPPGR